MSNDSDTLEKKLNQKLEQGEITQKEYTELYRKFQSLGILKTKSAQTVKKSTYPRSGSSVLEGGKVDGPVSISGRVVVDGPLECNRLNISGSAIIDGDLTVIGKSIISGTIEVGGITRFGDNMVTSGSINIDRSLYAMSKCSISGRAEINDQIISDGPIILTGELGCLELKSTSSVKVDGKLQITNSLICKDFECINGEAWIGGDLKAEMVRIFTNFREIAPEVPGINDSLEAGDITQLVSNVVNVFFPQLVKSFTSGLTDPKPSKFKIDGNIEADVVDISHTRVSGDIIANRVSIGPEVTVDGTIIYRNFIEVPEGIEYRIKQID